MKTILIADDVAFSRDIIKIFIDGLDLEVAGEATNGIEAIAKYKRLKPDILTLDLNMHEMGGTEALKEILKFDPEAVVIIISSTGDQLNKISEVMKIGAKAVFTKPFEKEPFIEELKKYLD